MCGSFGSNEAALNPRIFREMQSLIIRKSNRGPSRAIAQLTPVSSSSPVRRNKDRKEFVNTTARIWSATRRFLRSRTHSENEKTRQARIQRILLERRGEKPVFMGQFQRSTRSNDTIIFKTGTPVGVARNEAAAITEGVRRGGARRRIAPGVPPESCRLARIKSPRQLTGRRRHLAVGAYPKTDFSSRNSSRPASPHSRPLPDCL